MGRSKVVLPGVPSSYDEGGSTRWTPDAIAEVHALAQLGRYQVRGYNTFNKRMPTFDDLTFVPATMTRLPLEGYRENCETRTVLGAGRGLVEKPLDLKIPIYIASMSFGRPFRERQGQPRLRRLQGRDHDLHGRRRDARRRARSVTDAAVSNVARALPHRPRPSAPRGCPGDRGRPGCEARHRRALARHEGLRAASSKMRTLPQGVDQRSTIRHPGLSWAPTTCRSKSKNSGSLPTTRSRFS